MRKIILLLSACVFSFVLIAQERTVSKSMRENDTYYKYTGVAADTLISTNQDTIDFVLTYRGGGYINKIAVKSRFDVIAGADTTVAVSVFGKEFSDDATYVQVIASTVSSAVTADNVSQILVSDPAITVASYTSTVAAHVLLTDTTGLSGYPADSIAVPSYVITNAAQTFTPFDKSYRLYRIRYIIQGDDSVGTGIKIDEIEVKFYID